MTNAEKFKEDFGYDIDIDAMTICPFKNVETACLDRDVPCRKCLDDYWYNKEYQGEPTIPSSVIEKIHDAVDNAEPDSYLEYADGRKIAVSLTKEHVNEIIDKVVKEIRHDTT